MHVSFFKLGKFYMAFLSIANLLNSPAICGKIDQKLKKPKEIIINIKNKFYKETTSLYINIQFSEKNTEQDIKLTLPPYDDCQQNRARYDLPYKRISAIYCALKSNCDENEEECQEETLYAIGNFKPCISVIESLDIHIKAERFIFKPKYYLPPKFSEEKE